MKSAFGRRDLLLILQHLPEHQRRAAARQFGFEEIESELPLVPALPASPRGAARRPDIAAKAKSFKGREPSVAEWTDRSAEGRTATATIQPPVPTNRSTPAAESWSDEQVIEVDPTEDFRPWNNRPLWFWKPVKAEMLTADSAPAPVEAYDGNLPYSVTELLQNHGLQSEPAEIELLTTWARLVGMLREHLTDELHTHQLDIRTLTRRLAQGQTVRCLTFMQRRGWARHIVILSDRSTHLAPFFVDQDWLCEQLARICGHDAVSVRVLTRGPDSTVLLDRGRIQMSFRELSGVKVLALADLGLYEGPLARTGWIRLGRQLRGQGCELHALLPVPTGRWDGVVTRLWNAIPWERELSRGHRREQPELQARALRLLQLLAPSVRVEPGLLRAVRKLLPFDEADVGTEADLWAHPHVRPGMVLATTIDTPDIRRILLDALTREKFSLRNEIAARLRRWHAGSTPEIWAEEVFYLQSIRGQELRSVVSDDDLKHANELFEQIQGMLVSPNTDLRSVHALTEWASRVGSRMPADFPSSSILRRLVTQSWIVEQSWTKVVRLPESITMQDLQAKIPRFNHARSYRIYQNGRFLRFSDQPAGSAPVQGSLVAIVSASRGFVILHAEGGEPLFVRMGHGQQSVCMPQFVPFRLQTDRITLHVSREIRPYWASAAGRDRAGIWARYSNDQVTLDFRWIPPGTLRSPHGIQLINGFWLCTAPVGPALFVAITGISLSDFFRGGGVGMWMHFLTKLRETIGIFSVREMSQDEWEYVKGESEGTANPWGIIGIDQLNTSFRLAHDD